MRLTRRNHILLPPECPCAKQGLGIGIVVADTRTTEECSDAKTAQQGLDGRALERAAVVTMQHPRRVEDALTPHRAFHEIPGMARSFRTARGKSSGNIVKYGHMP